MRHVISEAEYKHCMSGDLREMFEVLANAKYLDVIATHNSEHVIVSQLVDGQGRDGGYFCNMSEVMHYDTEKKKYGYVAAIETGAATVEYFRYDTVDDARAHATELLLPVNSDI